VATAGNFFVLPKNVPHPKESLEFLTWMASPFAVNYWCVVEGNLPPAPSDAFGTAFWNAAPKERPWITVLKQATTIPDVPAISTYNFLANTLNTESQEMLYGKLTPSQGLSQLQQQASQNEQQFVATHPGWH
jgi:ABC-type glycerol-3-phosphate transport system substrate-binding protein